MNEENRAGDLNIKAGDGNLGGKGGDVNITGGHFQAGNAVRNTITVEELTSFLIPIIEAHSTLPPEKKQSLIKSLREGVGSVSDVAGLASLLFQIFGNGVS